MTLFGEDMIKYLTSDREPMADQSMSTAKVHLDEPMSFIGAAYRNMGKGSVTVVEITQIHHQNPP